MPANPPENMTRVTPNVFYDDPAAALEWLSKTFGFETRMTMPGPDGSIIHAEMQVADGVVMMSPASAAPEAASERPEPGGLDSATRQELEAILVELTDLRKLLP